MSTMQSGQFGTFQEDFVEQRTSIMAILSLVFGLLCIPGFGIVGALLGIAALFLISSSNGRLSGKGLAIAGLVISLLVSSLWIGFGYGAVKVLGVVKTQMVGPVNDTMTAIETGDYAAARKFLSPTTAAAVTDAHFDAFKAAYAADAGAGAYKSMPDGFMELLNGWAALGPIMQKYQQNQGDVIPLPGNFDKGIALVAVQIDKSAPPSPGAAMPPFMNIVVTTTTGNSYALYDPNATPGTPVVPPPATTPEPTPEPAPDATPDAPAPAPNGG
jgi:hypothetical protein